jgi:hypothetical protein
VLLSPSASTYSLLYIGFDTVWKKKEKENKEVNMEKSAAAYSRNNK